MRAVEHAKRMTGILAMAVILGLASPGVNAVRAGGDAAVPSAPDQCSLSTEAGPAVSADAQVEAFIRQVKRQQRARMAGGAPSEVILLNNRGYNYGPPSDIRLDRVMAEGKNSRH